MTEPNDNPAHASASREGTMDLSGSLLWLARSLWLILSLLSLTTLIVAVSMLLPSVRQIALSSGASAREWLASPSVQWLLLTIVDLGVAVGFVVAGLVIASRKPGDGFVLAVSAALILYGATMTGAANQLWEQPTFWGWLVNVLNLLSTASVPVLAYLFPDGRFVPRWTRMLATAWAVWALFASIVPPLNPYRWPALYLWLFFALGLGSALVAQGSRYHGVATPAQQQQTKWVIFGFAVAILGYLTVSGLIAVAFAGRGLSMVQALLATTAFSMSQLLVPICIGLSVLRYRLWDIDFFINRTMVYTIVLAIIGTAFYFANKASSNLVQSVMGRTTGLAPFASTVVSAVLFSPLKQRTQRYVDQRFYRDKVNVQTALAEFTHEIRRITDEDDLLQALMLRVFELLHLAHAAVYTLDSRGTWHLATAQDVPGEMLGRWTPGDDAQKKLDLGQAVEQPGEQGFPLILPLSLPPSANTQASPSGLVAALALGPRLSGAGFSREDRALLMNLADQIGNGLYIARTVKESKSANED